VRLPEEDVGHIVGGGGGRGSLADVEEWKCRMIPSELWGFQEAGHGMALAFGAAVVT